MAERKTIQVSARTHNDLVRLAAAFTLHNTRAGGYSIAGAIEELISIWCLFNDNVQLNGLAEDLYHDDCVEPVPGDDA